MWTINIIKSGRILSIPGFMLAASCSAQPDQRSDDQIGSLNSELSTQSDVPGQEAPLSETTASGSLRTIDTEPENVASARIVEKEDILVNAKPACAFTISYPDAFEQPVTWNEETCDDITATFLTRAKLAEMRKFERLSDDQKADLEAANMNKIFYIESSFTASIYPLNSAGRIYEISVAD